MVANGVTYKKTKTIKHTVTSAEAAATYFIIPIASSGTALLPKPTDEFIFTAQCRRYATNTEIFGFAAAYSPLSGTLIFANRTSGVLAASDTVIINGTFIAG